MWHWQRKKIDKHSIAKYTIIGWNRFFFISLIGHIFFLFFLFFIYPDSFVTNALHLVVKRDDKEALVAPVLFMSKNTSLSKKTETKKAETKKINAKKIETKKKIVIIKKPIPKIAEKKIKKKAEKKVIKKHKIKEKKKIQAPVRPVQKSMVQKSIEKNKIAKKNIEKNIKKIIEPKIIKPVSVEPVNRDQESVDANNSDNNIRLDVRHENLRRELIKEWSAPIGIDTDSGCTVKIGVDSVGKTHIFEIVASSGVLIFDISVQSVCCSKQWPLWLRNSSFSMTFQ